MIWYNGIKIRKEHTMKIAIAQTDIKFEDKEHNLKKAHELIRTAAQRGAELVLFPEMSFTGFSMNTALTGEAEPYTVTLMLDAAKKYNVAVGFGYVRLSDGKAENHYIIADAGGVRSDYIKLHSFAIGGEGSAFRCGESLPSPVSFGGQSVSAFICYDLRFPEIFRAVCDSTDIAVVAANWPASRRAHWETLLRARAIENRFYIVGINCTGEQDGISYSGGSMVIDPDGNTLAEAGDCEKLLTVDIPDDVKKKRRAFPVLDSRRSELYRRIADE